MAKKKKVPLVSLLVGIPLIPILTINELRKKPKYGYEPPRRKRGGNGFDNKKIQVRNPYAEIFCTEGADL
ncbi:MAG: hypothetical protein IJW29_04125 [Clostridia bacterium]|nr:hypothetical protein [Clostridia bacterium]